MSNLSWELKPESELSLMSHGDPELAPTKFMFAAMVRETIQGARRGDDECIAHLPLLITSLQGWNDPNSSGGFEAWNTRLGIVLGQYRCRKTGLTVCAEEGFTLEEAESLWSDTAETGEYTADDP